MTRGRPRTREPGRRRTLIEKWGGGTEAEAGELQRASRKRCAERYRNQPGYAERFKRYRKKHYTENKGLYYASASHATSLRRIAEARDKDSSLPEQPILSDEQKAVCIALRIEAYQRAELLGTKYVVDHIVEIADGGLEVPGNLQILTWEEHNKKSLAHRIAVRAAYRKLRGY